LRSARGQRVLLTAVPLAACGIRIDKRLSMPLRCQPRCRGRGSGPACRRGGSRRRGRTRVQWAGLRPSRGLRTPARMGPMTWSRRASRAAIVRAAVGGTRYRRDVPGLAMRWCRGACAGRRRVGYANSDVGFELGFRGSRGSVWLAPCRPACGGHPRCYRNSPTHAVPLHPSARAARPRRRRQRPVRAVPASNWTPDGSILPGCRQPRRRLGHPAGPQLAAGAGRAGTTAVLPLSATMTRSSPAASMT